MYINLFSLRIILIRHCVYNHICVYVCDGRTACTQPVGTQRFLCDGQLLKRLCTNVSPLNLMSGPLECCSMRWCHGGRCHMKVWMSYCKCCMYNKKNKKNNSCTFWFYILSIWNVCVLKQICQNIVTKFLNTSPAISTAVNSPDLYLGLKCKPTAYYVVSH